MRNKFSPISDKLTKFYHGGDYNPEQWLKYPEVLEEDIRLMKLSKCNVMSVGIFSWAKLEPQEGVYDFQWLDEILNKLYVNGIYFILATPSGARPGWMSKKYPEVLRVDSNRVRILHGERHNHCYTSPVYREKVKAINSKLAERYSNHPGLVAWHISNELSTECHCDLCQGEFRKWLKNKYKTLEELNEAWWSTFWSHTYYDWNEIESPAPHGETATHGLNLDWKRFITDRTVDFVINEIKPLKEKNPNIKTTINMMTFFDGLNYWKFKDIIDVASWDSYPTWHDNNSDVQIATRIAMYHDFNRTLLGGRPFMLMESTPSSTNWQSVSKLKKPGMHMLSSIQAVAHGSDTVQYFQWRKSRGSSEKFHGAVVDHSGSENTRVFKEVSKLGQILDKLDSVIGTSVEAEVGLIYDWENRWAINDAQGPRNCGIKYEETAIDHYKPFLENGVAVDVISMDCDFSKYKIIVAPMLYMVRSGVAERLEDFVKNGGTLVTTYFTGVVDENDLCFLGGFPGPLRKLMGVWAEEIDGLHDGQENYVVFNDNELKISGEYKIGELCELVNLEGAKTLAVYKDDFYKGMPAVTVNEFGNGKVYYVAARNRSNLNAVLLNKIMEESKVERALDVMLPSGVMVTKRCGDGESYRFLMNFNNEEVVVNLENNKFKDIVNDHDLEGEITIEAFGFRIMK